jgi:hypothetical protein
VAFDDRCTDALVFTINAWLDALRLTMSTGLYRQNVFSIDICLDIHNKCLVRCLEVDDECFDKRLFCLEREVSFAP